jgi:N-acetylneuraminate synthase
MSKLIEINGRMIGEQYSPYIIAEMSANHNGKIENAIKLIELAKKSGADAIKIQTYRPDTITIDCDNEDFQINGGLWDGQTLYKLYESAYMPWEWHKPLFEFARKTDITIFSSPFDNTAVDLLEDLNTPAYKIASFEAIDLPLIRYVAKTGKPMIISTGMANLEEIDEAIETARQGGCKSLAILHCVSGYPALASEYNLKTIPDMISRFDLVTGLSDHTLDNTTAIASIALGAAIVEKHFTLSRNGGGPDDSFSLEPQDLANLCAGCKTAWSAIGSINYGEKASEFSSMKHRRSLYFIKDLKSGDVITSENIKSIRPGMGLPPKYFDTIIGRKVAKDVLRGTAVNWTLLT